MAVGQTLTHTATPLATVAVHKSRPDWKCIARLISQWRPDALVVGAPLTMQGQRQVISAAADKFSRQLAGRFQLDVQRAEERLSTREAAARHGSREKRDDIAAQVILEGWLDGLLHDADGTQAGRRRLISAMPRPAQTQHEAGVNPA